MMQAFIFDMDGVIIDSEPLHARIKQQTLQHYGFPLAGADIYGYVGRTTKDFFQSVISSAGRKDITAAEMTDYKHTAYIDALRNNADIRPIDGIPELLEKLHASPVKVGLASSSDRQIIQIVLERLGLSDKFDVILSGTELPRSKPDPAIYLRAAELLAVKPANCMVLEDSQSGVAAAKAAGMYCIAYRNPSSGTQNISEADCIVEHISEIDIFDL